MSLITTPSPAAAKKLRANAKYECSHALLPGVDLVLARNPKDYTGPGTNTYIVGEERVWVIDPGPNDADHVEAVLAAVAGRQVAGVLVTHTHMDHSPAAQTIAKRTGAPTYGFGALPRDILKLTNEDVDIDFVPDIALADGNRVGSGDWKVAALHTPGHFPNHMAYFFPQQGLLFSGDHVMGWSTTVVVPPLGNMAEYLSSLDKLEALGAIHMLPSHGPMIKKPQARIEEVRNHRWARQRQVEDCVRRGITDPSVIVGEIYEGLTECLNVAARGCVLAHLEMLSGTLCATEHKALSQVAWNSVPE